MQVLSPEIWLSWIHFVRQETVTGDAISRTGESACARDLIDVQMYSVQMH